MQSLVDLLEISQNFIFGILRASSMAMENSRPLASGGHRPGMKLELFLRIVLFERHLHAYGNPFYFKFAGVVPAAKEQPHFPLA